MYIISYEVMAIVAVECGNPIKCSDIHYVSIGTNNEETDEELCASAREYLINEYPYAKVLGVIRLNKDDYNNIIKNQLYEYFKLKKVFYM